MTTRSPGFARLIRDVRACHACDRMCHTHALSDANGPLDAGIAFVAEAVGRRGGAITGVPLTRDVTGRRFEAFLALAGIDRSRCFVTNAVLCHPVDVAGRNRAPLASEVSRCRPHLSATFGLVTSPIVVALGRVALDTLRAIAPHDATLAVPARPVPWRGRTLVAMYHPSRQSTLHRSHDLQEGDWCALGDIVRGHAVSARP